MTYHRKIVTRPGHNDFEFDRNRNVIFFDGDVIYLTPHEAAILSILLQNRERPTPIALLIRGVYGDREPGAAAVSIRVAIHQLRKKILPTGMRHSCRVSRGLRNPRIGSSGIEPELERSHSVRAQSGAGR